jgi:peptidoglycan hydrolase-like protein with peptidoglycan-binding domain
MATATSAVTVMIAGSALAAVGLVGCHAAVPAATNGQGAWGGNATTGPGASRKPAASAQRIAPLHVLSVTPAGGSHGANGAAPIKVTFNQALAPNTPLPVLSPNVQGSWTVSGDSITFQPHAGFQSGTHVTLTIPGGENGMQAAGLATAGTTATAQADEGLLASTDTVSFTTGSFSTLRLQELLVQLGYLPLTFDPASPAAPGTADADANAQLSAAYDPPAGSFTFKPGYPSQLTSQWVTGKSNILDTGAIMAFQSDNGLAMDGVAGPQVWSHLFTALAEGKTNPNGYTYSLADQHSPETLRVWHNGKLIETTPVNTGVPGAGTADGTFPVFSRFQVTQMRGTDVDGTKYNDTVHWVSYFNGGDALHYYPRPGYGYYQSNGCVEMQLSPAEYIWKYTTYGSLVTVTGPVA